MLVLPFAGPFLVLCYVEQLDQGRCPLWKAWAIVPHLENLLSRAPSPCPGIQGTMCKGKVRTRMDDGWWARGRAQGQRRPGGVKGLWSWGKTLLFSVMLALSPSPSSVIILIAGPLFTHHVHTSPSPRQFYHGPPIYLQSWGKGLRDKTEDRIPTGFL